MIRRIVVVRGGALGDFILGLPALGMLRGSFPDARLELVGPGPLLPLARPLVDESAPIDRAEFAALFGDGSQLPVSLVERYGDLDLVVLWMADLEGAVRRNFARLGARRVIQAPALPQLSGVHAADHLVGTLAGIAGGDFGESGSDYPLRHVGKGLVPFRTVAGDHTGREGARPLPDHDVRQGAAGDEPLPYLADIGGRGDTEVRSVGVHPRRVPGGDENPSGTSPAATPVQAMVPADTSGGGAQDPALRTGEAVPRVSPGPDARRAADALWGRLGLHDAGRAVAIHPGSGGRWKCWPAERFARVAEALAAMGAQPVVIQGPADEEVVGRLLASISGTLPVVLGLDVEALAAFLARCSAYLGNDSGVTHLAAAVGVPVVAVFGPTDPAVWGPRGSRVAVLRKGERLESVSVEKVTEAVIRML